MVGVGVAAGTGEAGGEEGESDRGASSAAPAGARVSATLRFRKAICRGWRVGVFAALPN
jgi:hypothetical protein